MTTTAGRRIIAFATLDDVMPDVDQLLEGYTAVGRWSLGQTCNHLTWAFVCSVEGFSYRAPWLARKTIAPIIKRRMLKTRRIPEGLKIPGGTPPRPRLDDRAEAEALRGALRLFASHAGPMADHPFFETMTRDEVVRIHCIHCAHHLSFLSSDTPR